MEDSLTADDDGLLDVADLVDMFEAAEEATNDSRKLSERDRDYHDNIQLTAEEKKALKNRGQPEYIDNRIKTKVDYLVGLEKQQRINPRALPRTPVHEADADGATQALNYVADKEEFDYKRSAIWRNLLIEGAGGMCIAVEQDKTGTYQVKLRRIPWDRMFWDPHSAEVDFSDAGYLGTVLWMDETDALALYADNPDAPDILGETLDTASLTDTYDDKPKWNVWADRKRKRVRIVSIWLKRGEEWYFAEFTKGGILKAGPSPYVDDEGNSDCELRFQSAYVDRENNRYGLCREMISIQDAINKRNSKALHLLNTSQIVTNELAVAGKNVEQLRKESARPDGVMILAGDTDPAMFKFETRTDLAASQVQLLQENKQAIDLKGPNATQMGEKAQGSAAASGKAILASQQGGMISLGDLLDNLRHLDNQVFRAIWYRIRQFWTAPMWLRVTDDEQSVKWVGVNIDPMQAQIAAQQNPEVGNKIAGMVGNVAQLDCDIVIDEAPDSVTPAGEQWLALVDLAKAGVQIPPKVLIKSAPNLRNKKELLDEMGKPNPAQQMQQQLALKGAEAKVKLTEAETVKTMAEAQNIGAEQPQADPTETRMKMMEMAGQAEDRQVQRELGQMTIQGKRMDLAGKAMTLQQQRERPVQPAA